MNKERKRKLFLRFWQGKICKLFSKTINMKKCSMLPPVSIKAVVKMSLNLLPYVQNSDVI